jgi:asparagine synthase (glutamine-hydrolysing)
MCGINGFSWPDEALIRRMNRVTRFRGPDDEGWRCDAAVSLGHSRLAILDLSANGHQPMPNSDGTTWITYNGEVYNFRDIRRELAAKGHRFRSHTDTEVVLYAYQEYGLECFSRFNGMWGLAIYDTLRQRLVLCRDRFGVKPLYYHLTVDGRLIFSSMAGAILCHPDVENSPDERSVMEFLAFNLEQHNERTFFRDVTSLRPGHLAVFHLASGRFEVRRWYTPRPRPAATPEELLAAFSDSVRLRTVSDVPVGVCLSGGVDSTAITCILERCLPYAFNTFSLIVPGAPVDESRYIKAVGGLTRSTQHYTTMDEDAFLVEIEDFVRAQEEPVTGTSAYAQYRVFKLAHEKGAKVLLDGQGGDELFAGYVYYFAYYFCELLRRGRFLRLPREIAAYRRKFRDGYALSLFLFLLLPRVLQRTLWKRRINPWVNHQLLQEATAGENDPRWRPMNLRDSLTLTLLSTSIPHNLMWEDKSAMRWSVESRVPFLDFRVVELSMAIASDHLLGDGGTKLFFKQAMDSILPAMIRDRTDKIGFGTAEDDFLRKPGIAAWAGDLIASASFRERPWWHRDAVGVMLQRHLRGEANAGQDIWKCLHTELWARSYGSSACPA